MVPADRERAPMTERKKAPELDDTVAARDPQRAATTTGTRVNPSVLPPSMSSEKLAGRYEILSLLGSGGMGTVYRAKDLELDEIVALKVLRPELARDAAMLARFRQEVKLARRVTHPNVARTFDIGEHGEHRFLTMELVEGASLADALATGTPMPLPRIVEIAQAMCAGLTAAHTAGVVHRDLKPENVLLGNDGRVRITDFGVARLADATTGAQRTQGGAIGTPAYMAPEQVEAVQDIDARADIYALGAILFELWTGRRAWEGDSAYAVAARRLIEPPRDPRTLRPEIPEAAAVLILKCLAKDRDARCQSAADVAAALGRIASLESSPVLTPEPLAPMAPQKTVAVLPFENAGDPADSYLSDGLTDDLIDQLSMTDGLRVCSRGLLVGKVSKEADVRAIGQTLGVQVVVQGSVRRGGGRLRVTARALSVDDGFQLWAKRFDDAEAAFFDVSDRVVREVSEALSVSSDAAPKRARIDPVAVDLYLRARHEYYKFWPSHILTSIDLYEQALARAPNDPMILAGYAMALTRRASFDDAGTPQADAAGAAVRRAIRVAPQVAAVRVAKAQHDLVHGEVVLAAAQFRDVLRSTPDSAEALDLSGRLLAEAGAMDEGIARIRHAGDLDPTLASGSYEVGRLEALRGNRDASDAAFGDDPKQPGLTVLYWLNRCRATLWQRDTERARIWRDALSERTDLVGPVLIMLDAVLGKTPAEAFLQLVESRVTQTSPLKRRRAYFCVIAADFTGALGREDDALAALEHADDAGTVDLSWFDLSPSIAHLRARPRFVAIRDRVAARAMLVREALGFN
jgi:eukaryotic-like serine/threonine-protein kinase